MASRSCFYTNSKIRFYRNIHTKVKVKLHLYLGITPWRHTVGVAIKLYILYTWHIIKMSDLTAVPDFNSRERSPIIQWIRGWKGFRVSLDVVAKKYFYSSAANWISIIQPKASRKFSENKYVIAEFSLHGVWVSKFIIYVLKAKEDNSTPRYCWIPWRIN